MDAPGHILESTKGIEMKLGLYIDGSERNHLHKNHNMEKIGLVGFNYKVLRF